MRVVVAGLGVQGHKRRAIAGHDVVATVDPVHSAADFRAMQDVPLADFDAVLACIPDGPKQEMLTYLLSNRKHVLVEKPLWVDNLAAIEGLQEIARENDAVCYVAYNHRFEPHYVRMRDLIASGCLGKIYHCRMFYGNGTARLVRNSEWRDHGAGVLPDLGSHLLDTIRYWFGEDVAGFSVVSANRFENRSPDHVVICSRDSKPQVELEMTLLSWRNHFTCDVIAERGSAHIRSLCKWGPSSFTTRTRLLPSGRPPEETVTLTQDDPTWALEYAHFKSLCASGKQTDLSQDVWLDRNLSQLSSCALEQMQ